MRICFISDPNSIHTRRWVNWFAGHGHTACVVADLPLREPWPGIEVIDLSKSFFAPIVRFPIWVIYLKRIMDRWHPDIMHAHRVNSAGWIGAASGFHPFVLTPWGSDVFRQPQRSKLARLLAWYTLRHADLITVNSEAMGAQVIKLGARAGKIKQVQFGVELDIFTPNLSNHLKNSAMLKHLSLPENARLVFSPRAVKPIYNLDIILEAIPMVRERFPEVIFAFINYNTDLEYKKYLDSLSNRLGLENSIRWLPPIRNRLEIAELYHLSDVVISVPTTDGTPVSVLEAMACARPIISTDLPSLREFITPYENGLLVPVHQSIPLAEAIKLLLEKPELAKLLGQKASQLIAKKANIDVVMKQMEDNYLELAGEWRK